MRTDKLVGKRLGEFVIRERIGEGGFGIVYRAFQMGLDREAVVKVLHKRLRSTSMVAERFLREAKLASKLDHPYAAHVYAFGVQPDGDLWIAMELVRGTPLDQMLELQGPIPVERLVPLLERVAEVVQTAHDQGIVHRDLKPANVMVLARAGKLLPKLLDFGIAKALHPTEPGLDDTHPAIDENPADIAVAESTPVRAGAETVATIGEVPRPGTPLTQRGAVMGSPPYMAPEQWKDATKADGRTDLYALGALAYEALTGKPPFTGTTIGEIAQAHASHPPPPIGSRFPAALDGVFAKVLAKQPADRFASAITFAEAFREAAGIVGSAPSLPAIADTVRETVLSSAPQPIAEAVAIVEAARNSYQARDAHLQLLRTIARYLGLVALACRSRVSRGEATAIGDVLRALYRRPLDDREWFELARQLTAEWIEHRDAYPIPELVDLFHGPTGDDAPAVAIVGRLLEQREAAAVPGLADDVVAAQLERCVGDMTALLDAIGFLANYPMVVPLAAGIGERWMGVRRAMRTTTALRGSGLAAGAPALLDGEGAPALSLAPLFQIAAPTPGAPLELFMFDGRGRHGAKLLALPSGFEHHDDSLWDWFRAQLTGSFDDDEARAAEERPPYRGLSTFSADDTAMFFGREKQVDAFVNRLHIAPLLVVVGRSGAGKSSFVQAGVVPALPAGSRALTLRPGASPIATLAARLHHAGIAIDGRGDAIRRDPAALGEILRADATANGPLLLVVDQLEELLTLCADPDERRAFADAIAGSARAADDPVRVVFTLRDDFLVRAEQLPALRNRLGQALQLLTVPGTDDLLRILIEPARRAGYEFEDPALPAEMVKEVADQPGALALLSFTAAKLWELRDRHFKQLTRAAYRSLGGVGGALARHAELTLDGMLPEERRLTREAFRHLVTTQNTRAVLDRGELRELLGGGEHADGVVEKLVAARLLVASENERGGESIEVVHEALLTAWPRLVEWRRDDSEGARLREQLRTAARQWNDRARSDGLLWRGDALADFMRWRARHPGPLTDVERSFADASTRAAVRGRRLRRGLLAATIGVLAIGIVLLLDANASKESERQRAAAAQQRAEASQQLALAEQGRQQFLAGDPMRSLIYLHAAREAGADDAALHYLLSRTVGILAKKQRTLSGHAATVSSVIFSHDGRRVYTRSADATARIWDVASGAPVAVLTGHTGSVQEADLDRDGNRLVTGGEDTTIRIWDAATGTLVHTLASDSPLNYVTQFSRDGRTLLSGGLDGAIRIWDASTGAAIATLPGTMGTLVDATFTADASAIYVVGASHDVVRWDIASRTKRVLLEPRATSQVCARCSIRLDPGGDFVVAVSDHGAIVVWDRDGTQRSFDLRSDVIAEPPAFGSGSRVAVPVGPEIQVWDLARGQRLVTLRGHQAPVTHVAFSPDGTRIASSAEDGTVRLWDAASALELGVIPSASGVRGVAFSPDGSTLAIGSGRDVELWSARADMVVRSVSYGLPIAVTALAPDGAIAACGFDGSVGMWDAIGRPTATWKDGDSACITIAYSRDGSLIAKTHLDGTVGVWESASGKHRTDLRAPGDGRVSGAVFDPTGSRVLTAHQDRVARIWSVRTGAIERTLEGHTNEVSAVAWSHDPDRVATCGFDAQARLWNVKTGASTVLSLEGICMSIAFSPDDSRVIAAGRNTARIWSVDDPTRWIDLEDHHGDDHATFVSPTLVATYRGRAVRLWDVDTGRLVDTWPHAELAHAVGRDHAGHIATISGLHVVVWELPSRVDVGRERSLVDSLPLMLRDGLIVSREMH